MKTLDDCTLESGKLCGFFGCGDRLFLDGGHAVLPALEVQHRAASTVAVAEVVSIIKDAVAGLEVICNPATVFHQVG